VEEVEVERCELHAQLGDTRLRVESDTEVVKRSEGGQVIGGEAL
jgi:hypothetical protein